MNIWNWPTMMKARLGSRTVNILQILLLCTVGSVVLLRDSIGVGIELTLNTASPVEANVMDNLIGPKRNIASVEEKSVRELESVVVEEQQPPPRHPEKSRAPVVIEESPTVAANGEEKASIESNNVKPQEHQNPPVKDERAKRKKQKKPRKEEEVLIQEIQQPPVDDSNEQGGSSNLTASEPFSLGKNPKNWDQLRLGWLEKYPFMRTTPNGKPRMLMITGTQPWACKNPGGDHLMLKSIKNKIDYCRQHDIELFYNLAHLDREMSSYWAKLPIIRKLMLTHPEIEWFFWMDADAMFTDMLFEIPMETYGDYNLVMWGYDKGIYTERAWIAVNNGVFFFRNCQWSLDLLEMWAPMGPEGTVRNEWGKLFTEFLTKRPVMPADDQSALVYLLLTKPELRAKVKLEWAYELSGYWLDFVYKFEELMVTPGNHPGQGDKRWPFVVHFTGCQPCSGNNNPVYTSDTCAQQMERAFNFADNQVLQAMGFQHENLNSSYTKRIFEDTEEPLENLGPNTWATAAVSYGV
ncbi:xyloglucan 6-xylosyltransferase [Marchantia polymorpha subsp. ruderalis]|nr:hypothetical protein MARPO_0132s0001 [Marchantia polymorpha]BBN08189.1 hypothetical protein Mp_4g09580 [Marchantia polymorpha subsp. ruderalis]PTQ29920.1 hypothetical protein MARPO_0132s0001 [Marchantia polymorpha]PTQ29921.1 hypothetical protein MARPO_0132s0001 [Marchantia polymorpha]BBN08190.1 hypothetical protein Mp_4g09580 [Marchantia polymorpha subsp. ruderalis]|eukprot:PTQ29919.1 hypothetical protein MARPO_0132s0001 [Marchantia polymorpha]